MKHVKDNKIHALGILKKDIKKIIIIEVIILLFLIPITLFTAWAIFSGY